MKPKASNQRMRLKRALDAAGFVHVSGRIAAPDVPAFNALVKRSSDDVNRIKRKETKG